MRCGICNKESKTDLPLLTLDSGKIIFACPDCALNSGQRCGICNKKSDCLIPVTVGCDSEGMPVTKYLCMDCGMYDEDEPKDKPSKIKKNGYWCMAITKKQRGHYPTAKPRSGKWLIFVDRKNVDEVWAKVKKATEENKLGRLSKVSTAKLKPADLGYQKDRHVICVYTDDWTDEKDVKRVREELRKLGITDKIPYKADEDTWSGKYRARGHTRISKYYE